LRCYKKQLHEDEDEDKDVYDEDEEDEEDDIQVTIHENESICKPRRRSEPKSPSVRDASNNV
jgi:hypothetical protein